MRSSLRVFAGFFLLALAASADLNAAPRSVPEESLPEVVTRVQPSVVNVQTDRSYRFRDSSPGFLRSFTRDFYEQKDMSAVPVKCQGVGSGIIIESSGVVLTNAHVVDGAENIQVMLSDRRVLKARLVGKNKKFDLALLQIEEGGEFPAASLADSDKVRTGEDVFAIGTPYSYSQTVTRGIVSAAHRELRNGDTVLFEDVIQTDTAVNPGNSGGPLMNVRGEVIGVVSMEDWRAQGIGFAIPANTVKKMIPELKTPHELTLRLAQFKTRYGFLPEEIREEDGQVSILVAGLTPGSMIARSGLTVGDSLRRFKDLNPQGLEELLEESEKPQSGRIYLEFLRGKRAFFTYLEVSS